MRLKYLFIFSFFILNLLNVVASDDESKFKEITLSKSYKELDYHNPCIANKFIAEPGVMEYNNRIYVYGTDDGPISSAGTQKDYQKIFDISIMSSSDLVNWSDHGSIRVADDITVYDVPIINWGTNCNSPSVVHKTVNGKEKFFLYFAMNSAKIGILVSDSPIGPWKDAKGSALDLVEQYYGHRYNDPSVFIDNDGSAYLYYGRGLGQFENPQTLRVVKLGDDMISIEGNPIIINAPWALQGSVINKIGDTYLLSYNTYLEDNPYGQRNTIFMTSKSPLGPFDVQGICFKNPGEFFIPTINGHHDIIYFKGKYYIFYQAAWLDRTINGSYKGHRATHVDVMPINGNLFGNAIGTLTGVEQIEYIDPYQINAFYTSAWQAGITVIGTPGDITCYKRGDWNGVSGVNFSKGAKKITINGGCSYDKGATIRITADSPSGDVLGYVTFPFTSPNFQVSINVTSEINNISGVKNIFFVASDTVFLNYYVFSP